MDIRGPLETENSAKSQNNRQNLNIKDKDDILVLLSRIPPSPD